MPRRKSLLEDNNGHRKNPKDFLCHMEYGIGDSTFDPRWCSHNKMPREHEVLSDNIHEKGLCSSRTYGFWKN